MSTRLAVLALSCSLLAPAVAWGDPPAHAPAHGYRRHKAAVKKQEPSHGVEVVFDSTRGVYVAVGLPDVFFHEGRYYRQHDGRWQVSVDGRGGWSFSASGSIPTLIVKAWGQPGPAKLAPRR